MAPSFLRMAHCHRVQMISAAAPRFSSPSPAPASPRVQAPGSATPTLLLVGAVAGYGAGLTASFRVVAADTVSEALATIERERPALIATSLILRDGSGTAICEAVRRFEPPATVLVTTGEPTVVPDAIAAGCASVLLEPFPPNLLYSRLGRLARERARDLKLRASFRSRRDDGARPAGASLRSWPEAECPHCHKGGASSFEFVSHRRAWFACVPCRKVWIGRRLEDI